MLVDVNILLFMYSVLATSGLVPSQDIQQILPDVRICRRSDPNLNRCLQQTLETLKPYLKSGIPTLEIPSCEPLHLSEIMLKRCDRIAINSTCTDVLIRGATDYVVKSVDISPDLDRLRIVLYMPRLELEGRYDMNGKVLSMPMIGNGFATSNCTSIDATLIMKGEKYELPEGSGQTYYRVNDLDMDFDVGHVSVEVNNLRSDQKLLTNAMNLFLNNNWRSVIDEIKPAIEDTVGEIFKSIANKVYTSYPLDTLMPP